MTVFSNCTKTPSTTHHRTTATPVATTPQATTNPSTKAAAGFVDQSIADLENHKTDSAEWNLEEAMRIAPNYGPAYYWIARLKLVTGEVDKARSFLDKAETLTSQNPDMKIKIDELRGQIP